MIIERLFFKKIPFLDLQVSLTRSRKLVGEIDVIRVKVECS